MRHLHRPVELDRELLLWRDWVADAWRLHGGGARGGCHVVVVMQMNEWWVPGNGGDEEEWVVGAI